jgi:hypothetical protein
MLQYIRDRDELLFLFPGPTGPVLLCFLLIILQKETSKRENVKSNMDQ